MPATPPPMIATFLSPKSGIPANLYLPEKALSPVNSGEIVETMVLQDAGIAYLPNFFVAEHIAEGRMVRLLDDAESPALGMYLVYPQTRQLAPQDSSVYRLCHGSCR